MFIKAVGYSILGCWALGAMCLFCAVPGLLLHLDRWLWLCMSLGVSSLACSIPLVIVGGIYNIVMTGDVIGR